jgi:hypothetical protein
MELVIALVALITVAVVYAVVMWIDTPTPPGRPPSAPAALCIWNAAVARVYLRKRIAPWMRKGSKRKRPAVHPGGAYLRRLGKVGPGNLTDI